MYRYLKRHLRADFESDEEMLHAFIRDGDLPKLRQLLEPAHAHAHAHINHLHPFLGSPLHYAARCGDLDAVELLLAAGADLFLVGCQQLNMTAIGLAAFEGHRDAVRRLWTAASPKDQLRNVRPHQACLIIASTYGRAAIVHDLLACWDGWPQELKNEALLWAARRWHFDVVRLLLKAGNFEQSTLQQALCYSTAAKVMMTHEYYVKCEGFDYLNQQCLIALLVDIGADPNHSLYDNTPLLCGTASDANLTGALRTLLEKGADPNVTNKFGQSALHVVAGLVAKSQFDRLVVNEAAIQLLLDHKGSVAQPDETGETPLHKAAFGLDLRLFRLYLSSCPDEEQDALLFSENHHAETLLHFAAAGCRIETVEFLITKGLDVNAKNSNGWAPLMCTLVPIGRGSALSPKSPDEAIRVARCLLSHGADAAVTTDEGWTALHGLALYRDYDFCEKTNAFAKELISHGANPHACACLPKPEASSITPDIGMPWGHRLRQVMANPSTAKRVVGPRLSVLSWAAQRGAVGVVKALLAHGVHVSMDGGELAPARLAAESQYLRRMPELADRIIKLLLDAGAGF